MKRLKYLAMAALVAFAACDEGDEVPTPPAPVTGSITGTVTIDGVGAAGVSVALSGGSSASATTDASGRYTFADVLAGSYTVTISGTPSDASFGSMSSDVVVSEAGQVRTADFSGSYIKTSSVAASVGVAGVGQLSGVTVTLSGANLGGSTMTMDTDANGAAVFAGLRAGTYDVAISGYDAGQYSFGTTTMSVTVAQGASASAPFSGTRNATGQITGIVTLDGVAAAGVSVALSNGETKTTAANGRYAFGNLLPGQYTVTISNLPNDAVFPATNQVATVAQSGDVVTTDFTGNLVGTASISGAVLTAGSATANVTVTLAGPSAGSMSTAADGTYAFSDLLSGTYTVTISGYDAAQNQFTATSMTVSVNPGEAKAANFSGTVPTTSTITGVATIDGAAAAGLTVTMGAATATTDANGRYTFSNLGPGSYTLTISGAAADVQWTAATQVTTIDAAAETDVVDFAGIVRLESTIAGIVTGAGVGQAGVTVTVTGNGVTKTATTDANGVYAVDQLRMGTYTVTISGFDGATYNFTTTTASVTVGLAQSEEANFSAPFFLTASISGRMFIDVDGDNSDDADEPTITDEANITFTLVGGDVATSLTQTTSDGTYSFTGLAPGNYNLTITVAGVSATYALGQTAVTNQIRPLAVGQALTSSFPFDINTQTITVGAMMGRDENASAAGATVPSRVQGFAGQSIRLYDTYANALLNNGATGLLGTATTGAAGTANISFLRANDASPQGGVDRIVFAVRNGAPAVPYVADGEAILEINYNNNSASFTAPDVFDVLNTRAELDVTAQTVVTASPLNGWEVEVTRGATFGTAVNVAQPLTAANGMPATVVENLAGVGSLPATYYMRLDQTIQAGGTQPTNGHNFTDTGIAGEGSATADYVQFTFDGTRLVGTPVNMGILQVSYDDRTLNINVHNEQDEVAGRTAGDGFTNANKIDLALTRDSDGATVNQTTPLPSLTGRISTATGAIQFPNVPTNSAMTLAASPSALFPGELRILTSASTPVTFDGSDTTFTVTAVAGGAASAFAYKHINNTIGGTSLAASDGTPAAGLTVTLTPGTGHIQPWHAAGAMDGVQTTTTNGAGAYNFTGVQEGPYTITITDNATWDHQVIVAGNDGTNTESRDVQGAALAQAAVNFTPRHMNTTFNGQVFNDRDADGNVTDPNEAAAGITMSIFEDLDNDGNLDANESTAIQTTTTGTNGGYGFTGLPEGNYLIQAPTAQVNGYNVLNQVGSALSATVTTTAGATTLGSQTNVGTLPRWNYVTSTMINNATGTNFTFLYANTSISGTVTNGVTGLQNVTVSLQRCSTNSLGATPSPPALGNCTGLIGSVVNGVTDASGNYSFSNLQEGVYQVTVNPASGGAFTGATYNAVAGVQLLFTTIGSGDVEAQAFNWVLIP